MRVEAGWQLTVEGPALALERVDDVEGRHGLALGVFGVCDRVADDVLEEHLEDTAGLLVDEAGDTLDTATASQTADSRLGDALDVVAQNLAVALRSALAETFSSFAAARHVVSGLGVVCEMGGRRRAAGRYLNPVGRALLARTEPARARSR